MKTHDDPRNPARTRIRRVDNGWIMTVGYDYWEGGSQPVAEYVFTDGKVLGAFIAENFELPAQEDAK